MAQFKGSIGGNGGSSVSRLGSKKSGLVVEANGWDLGVRVRAYVNEEGKDCFDVYQTRGSGSWADGKLLVSIKEE